MSSIMSCALELKLLHLAKLHYARRFIPKKKERSRVNMKTSIDSHVILLQHEIISFKWERAG